MSGDKALVQNMNGDQLGALQVTNTGTTPLWVRLDSTGYPDSAPQPFSNVLQIERHILGNRRQFEIALFAEER
ncbi:protein YfhM [Enterobacter cloacae]|uniref:Protein YfhM n=1 Tax=Enterobacter cloacae TaxID=550 RepID=A0A377LWX8_ENTCL|nr:protein YfhM [Enterobacter cloacae]